MNLTRKINEDTYYLGVSDRRLALFENIYPIERGVSYNSYLVLDDEKTVLFDTVDHSVAGQFLENLEYLLNGRKLDYIVVNHVEPDHAGVYEELIVRYPNLKLIGNAKTFTFLSQFNSFDVENHAHVVKEGDTFSSGRHTFHFVFAPMVHWPEVMVCYDDYTKTLFSADAFGTFGALSGNIFADEVGFECNFLDDARRYFVNIVGKYGVQVLSALKKASSLDIQMICPLHGPIWRENIAWFIEKHRIWASYEPEEDGTLIIYASIYGNTENACSYLASLLAEKGEKRIKMYDVSKTDSSYLVAECFRYSRIVFASPTYNLEIFPKMEALLLDLKAHLWQNRRVALIENGTWAIQSGKKMKEILSAMKNIDFRGETVTIKSSMKEENKASLDSLAEALISE